MGLALNDSACTTIYAYADPVFVEVHSLSNPVIYGSAAIHPLSPSWQAVVTANSWRAVVTTAGVTAGRNAACS